MHLHSAAFGHGFWSRDHHCITVGQQGWFMLTVIEYERVMQDKKEFWVNELHSIDTWMDATRHSVLSLKLYLLFFSELLRKSWNKPTFWKNISIIKPSFNIRWFAAFLFHVALQNKCKLQLYSQNIVVDGCAALEFMITTWFSKVGKGLLSPTHSLARCMV